MIEIINPGWQSLVVDKGRYGYGHIGVPPSSALDHFAYTALNYMLGNNRGAPALEVLGKGFSITFGTDLKCAITGAKVMAQVNEKPVPAWKSFEVKKGAILRVKEVVEGFRYYVGFSGLWPWRGSSTVFPQTWIVGSADTRAGLLSKATR